MDRWTTIAFLLLVSFNLTTSTCYDNLLLNSDLEEDAFTDSSVGWFRRACTATLSSDSFTGQGSVMVTNRKASWAGMAHYVKLEAGKNYFFTGYIKLLNTAVGKITDSVTVTMFYQNVSTGAKKYLHVGSVRFMQPKIWQRIGADLTVLPGYDKMMVYIQVQSTDVSYLLDTTSLREIPPLPWNWETAANTVIDDIRKAHINIVLTSGDTKGVSVEVTQETSEFAFGTAVSAELIVDSQQQSQKYQNFFDENFEWATIENKLKWKQTERKKGVLKYESAQKALDALVANGKKVRGHTVFWGVPDKDPEWIQDLEGDGLELEMRRRVRDVTLRTMGQLEHWDVNNENVHGNFYEEALGHANATMEIFKVVKSLDPKAKLFLNDFAIVSSSSFTQAYRNQAMMYRDTLSVPIYGVGIQSHLKPPLDLTLIKHRLDQIADIGLPVWITELDIDEADENKKADLLENVLRLYFSTPAVEGVILWGFWDGRHWIPDAALANGPDVTPNAAGQRWQQLVKNDWRTSATRSMETGSIIIHGFKGEYSLKVMRDNIVVQEQQFVLSSGGTNIMINL